MTSHHDHTIEKGFIFGRREFLQAGSAAGLGLLASRTLAGSYRQQQAPPARPKTNLEDVLKIPKTPHSLPGPFPGKVVEIRNPESMAGGKPDAGIIKTMFGEGIRRLSGKDEKKAFSLFFEKNDTIGIKVNPVGAGLISTRLELVDAVADWLISNGVEPGRIVIWDRFEEMLRDAGFTEKRFPGLRIEGLQTMDEAAAEGKTQDNSKWRRRDGTHVSTENFDQSAYYWVDEDAPKDDAYLNQHVFNGKYSYFGKLLTQRLTKIINLPVFKNSGPAVSMATKNMGYGAICNTNRLHKPLGFDVCVEVLAFPAVRDKLVLNVMDGLRAQYEGGPGPEAKYVYDYGTLFFATDPIAMDAVGHRLLVEKRKAMNITVVDHPRFTEYLRHGEKLGLGFASPEKIEHLIA